MKLFIFFLLVLSILLTTSEAPRNTLEMRREVLFRTKYGKLICSVIHDTVTNSYVGVLLNDNFYKNCPWVYKRLNNEESKRYYDSFASYRSNTSGSR